MKPILAKIKTEFLHNGEANEVVRGVSRRVVVVKPQASDVFEQAIFILKDDPAVNRGMQADDILKEACQTANCYLKRGSGRQRGRFNPAVFVAAGAGATGIIWLITALSAMI